MPKVMGTNAEQREQEDTLRRLRGGPANVGQCDGCPEGQAPLCKDCRLCTGHCRRNGCGYSPHHIDGYALDEYV